MFKSIKVILINSIIVLSGITNAGVITTPQDAVINAGGLGFGNIENTIDQSGLTLGYTSGVTDFDAYLASAPTHVPFFSGNEWFSNTGVTLASVTFDMGMTMSLLGAAIWNEESAGIGSLEILTSLDNITFTSFQSGITLTNHPAIAANYGADVIDFGTAINARYIRFDMTGCPQPGSIFDSCSIGEVAFEQGEVVSTNTPSMLAFSLISLGLLGIRKKF